MLTINLWARRKLWGMAFAAPVIFYFLIFSVYPILNAFYTSFTRYDFLSPRVFVGLQNYRNLLNSPEFPRAAGATFYFILLAGPIRWVLGFGLAWLLHGQLRGKGIFRSIYFLPSILSVVAVGVVWKLLLHPSGPLNTYLGTTIYWLNRTRTAMLGVGLMVMWRGLGYFMLLFLAGLESIPREFYDAAKVDGAGSWAVVRHITLPLMRPVIAFVVIITFINGLKVFAPVYVMTRGGPVDATRTIAMLIYEHGLVYWKMGLASAESVVLFFLILVLTLIQLKVFRVQETD
jgi:multiple sugar transport system permease protein